MDQLATERAWWACEDICIGPMGFLVAAARCHPHGSPSEGLLADTNPSPGNDCSNRSILCLSPHSRRDCYFGTHGRYWIDLPGKLRKHDPIYYSADEENSWLNAWNISGLPPCAMSYSGYLWSLGLFRDTCSTLWSVGVSILMRLVY